MARRLFPDNDGWTSEASRAANNATVAFMDLLAILEEDGPVDLKDFHFIVTHAVGSFVAGLSVTRRLGGPTDPPDPIIRSYPRLSAKPLRGERGTQGGDKLPATMDEDWNIKWICGSTANSHCVYDDETDPAHDECVYCGEPQERK